MWFSKLALLHILYRQFFQNGIILLFLRINKLCIKSLWIQSTTNNSIHNTWLPTFWYEKNIRYDPRSCNNLMAPLCQVSWTFFQTFWNAISRNLRHKLFLGMANILLNLWKQLVYKNLFKKYLISLSVRTRFLPFHGRNRWLTWHCNACRKMDIEEWFW